MMEQLNPGLILLGSIGIAMLVNLVLVLCNEYHDRQVVKIPLVEVDPATLGPYDCLTVTPLNGMPGAWEVVEERYGREPIRYHVVGGTPADIADRRHHDLGAHRENRGRTV